MELEWTGAALADLERLYDFLAPVNPAAAARAIQALVAAPLMLLDHPRMGTRLDQYDPREVRRILVGRYEMRYEVLDSTIFLLRLSHTREDR